MWWVYYTLQRSKAAIEIRVYEPSDGASGHAIFQMTNVGGIELIVLSFGLQQADGGADTIFHLRGRGRDSLSLELPPAPPITLAPGRTWSAAMPRFEVIQHYGERPTVVTFACTAEQDEFLGAATELWGLKWEQQLREIADVRRHYVE
jgi:hypothetical protein